MPRVTEPLREEHRELLPHLEALREAGGLLSGGDPAAFRAKLDEAYAFLSGHLLAHATAEERALYPVVARVMGADMATNTMSRDHVEIAQLTEQLGAARDRLNGGAPDEAATTELRELLYGLYAMVKLHFAKEEEIYLPLLDEQLDAASAAAMFEAMERAAAEAKQSHHA